MTYQNFQHRHSSKNQIHKMTIFIFLLQAIKLSVQFLILTFKITFFFFLIFQLRKQCINEKKKRKNNKQNKYHCICKNHLAATPCTRSTNGSIRFYFYGVRCAKLQNVFARAAIVHVIIWTSGAAVALGHHYLHRAHGKHWKFAVATKVSPTESFCRWKQNNSAPPMQ